MLPLGGYPLRQSFMFDAPYLTKLFKIGIVIKKLFHSVLLNWFKNPNGPREKKTLWGIFTRSKIGLIEKCEKNSFKISQTAYPILEIPEGGMTQNLGANGSKQTPIQTENYS